MVNKSTVPVGSGDYVSMSIREGLEEAGRRARGAELPGGLQPRVLEGGSAVYDSLFPDRIVVGLRIQEALDTLRALYEPIIEQSFPTELDPRPKVAVPFVTTDLVSAEMIKYASNAFLATKISFINEISNLCELVGADVAEVAYGIGLDGRIGLALLSAGSAGAGRASPRMSRLCARWPKSTSTSRSSSKRAVAVNERQRKRVVGKLQRELRTLKGKRMALLGSPSSPTPTTCARPRA